MDLQLRLDKLSRVLCNDDEVILYLLALHKSLFVVIIELE
jgi:hypothetical protein